MASGTVLSGGCFHASARRVERQLRQGDPLVHRRQALGVQDLHPMLALAPFEVLVAEEPGDERDDDQGFGIRVHGWVAPGSPILAKSSILYPTRARRRIASPPQTTVTPASAAAAIAGGM